MPQKGESASFFSLRFYCNIQAGLPLPPPFLPPSCPSPPPLLRRESWTGEVSTQEPKLSTSSESRRQSATAGERERRRARGGRPAQSQRQRGLISQEEPRLRAPQPPRLPATALPNAPGRRRGRRGSAVPQARERLQRSAAAGRFVQSRAQRARREPRAEGAPREPARLATARPPSGFVRRSPGLRGIRWHPSAQGHRARRQLEQSVGTAASRRRPKERAREREPGRKLPGPGGGTRAPRELGAERGDCQLPSSPQALAPNLGAELGT